MHTSSLVHTHIKQSWMIKLAQFAKLEFLENLQTCKDTGVDNTSNGESATHDGTNSGKKVVQGRSSLVVLDGYGIEVVAKPKGGHHSAPVPEGYVTPVGISILIGNQFSSLQVLVGSGDNFHDIFVRLEAVGIQFRPVCQRVE